MSKAYSFGVFILSVVLFAFPAYSVDDNANYFLGELSKDEAEIDKALNQIELNPEISLNEKVRKKLLQIYLKRDSNRFRIANILRLTNEKAKKQKVTHKVFSDDEKKRIMQNMKSGEKNTFFKGYNEFISRMGLTRDAVLILEGFKFDVDKKFLESLYLEIKQNSAYYLKIDSAIQTYLEKYCPEIYEKDIPDYLIKGSKNGKISTLTYLRQNHHVALKNRKPLAQMYRTENDKEIVAYASDIIALIQDEELNEVLAERSVDVTAVVRAILNAFNTKKTNSLLEVIDNNHSFFISNKYYNTDWRILAEGNGETGLLGKFEDVVKLLDGTNCLSVTNIKLAIIDDEKVLNIRDRYLIRVDLSSYEYLNNEFKDKYFGKDEKISEPVFAINFKLESEKEIQNQECENKRIIAVCIVYENEVKLLGIIGRNHYYY